MNSKSFHEKLEQLHEELSRTQEIDESNREYLQHLMGDIQSALNATHTDDGKQQRVLAEHLHGALGRLELSHPKLVLTIGQVLDHLAQL